MAQWVRFVQSSSGTIINRLTPSYQGRTSWARCPLLSLFLSPHARFFLPPHMSICPPMRQSIRPGYLRPLDPTSPSTSPFISSKQSQRSLLHCPTFLSSFHVSALSVPHPLLAHAQCYPTLFIDLHSIHASVWCIDAFLSGTLRGAPSAWK